MQKAHYVIFHPDFIQRGIVREEIQVQASAIVDGEIDPTWKGKVFVDAIGNGNEDPFVFSEKWIYSYCHASQLRRKPGSCAHLQPGSYLIFVSGEGANKDTLIVDTVFVIEYCHKWGRPLSLPLKFSQLQKDKTSDLWNRHFQFPFRGYHKSVTYTYEAKMWTKEDSSFSFLPVSGDEGRPTVSLDNLSRLSQSLVSKIRGKVKGKYPVLISEKEKDVLMESIISHTKVQVIGRIKQISQNHSSGKKTC